MARKGTAHKVPVSESEAVPSKQKKPSDQCKKSSPSRGQSKKTNYSKDGRKNIVKSENVVHKESSEMNTKSTNGHATFSQEQRENGDRFAYGSSEFGEVEPMSIDKDSEYSRNPSGCLQNGVQEKMASSGSLDDVGSRSLGTSALSVLEIVREWLKKQNPRLTTLRNMVSNVCDCIIAKTKYAYPIIWRWLHQFGKTVLLLSLVWLDCSLRGFDSLFRLGTTSFFTVIWCSILSVTAMIGTSKFLIMVATTGMATILLGFSLAIVIVAFLALVFLWMYGSFWITGLVILVGGVAFLLNQERIALLITTLYAIYSAKLYVGWLGLFLGINLSFISSDVLIYFLKNNINERESRGATDETQGRPGAFFGEPLHSGSSDPGFQTATARSTDQGFPSTSGASSETELTSEEEVVRLLNCADHYAALGLSRFENIDVQSLKREYRKKAMLVHPDKNMGNEKAAEAFKKLQNAYEVLLDSLKRKSYDDELRREELLNYIRRFQSASQRKGRQGFFGPGFSHSEVDEEEPNGDSKRIACKKCNNFHLWVHTDRSKSRARWCQDCKDYHQAKDGDGWIEQSGHSFFFGLLQKVDTPYAYVCAESRIYNATDWFICQGMRCPSNTHKPSFHVNTSMVSKHASKVGGGTAHRPGGPMPKDGLDENMTEEAFFEWLQNAVRSGMFEGADTPSDSPGPMGSNGNSGKCNKNSGKKKKKGKKQW
ncbi:hypothetical protein AMTRI_Chr02g220690 [Amborella trichopoda]|uniref:J domain-containing protein n=1 Tax=Amborella trichopoda TaxID=13333 RepID=W1P5F8_AMBTC|nr:uncharacterized protein LOC18431290 [Amborella trichopoda]XP_020521185.1 uncharacterized protein LOC18431290 [Amborella trichopoda]ERN03153.1 hypothetical protein AMTR_s00003p00109530 [Amborella trichopoda]|eukprot:XP_006841478.1 uncharacterized protein LOC18431290 [Amborella trichopoda]